MLNIRKKIPVSRANQATPATPATTHTTVPTTSSLSVMSDSGLFAERSKRIVPLSGFSDAQLAILSKAD